MSNKRNHVVEELDPEGIEGMPDLHKAHYLKLGYKPYLMGDGKVKWLTSAQRVYKESKNMHGRRFGKKKSVAVNGMKRKRRSNSSRILKILNSWWLLLLVTVVVVTVLIVMFGNR